MINRQKLIEAIDDNVAGLTNMQIMQIADIIESQPPAEQWIPCSERLPEESGEYITTVIWGNKPTRTTGAYDAKRKEWSRYSYNPIAWMEWPEPYKGDEK